MFVKFLALLLFVICLDDCFSFRTKSKISSRQESCQIPYLSNGRGRVTQRGRVAKFSCFPSYELVGNRYATCRDGEWDEPAPVCVKPGCPSITLENGIPYTSHSGAWVVSFCYPYFVLRGSSALYCDGTSWNGTAPICVATALATNALSCDFEDPKICNWSQDEFHDFDWRRHFLNTPSAFVKTGPSHDHTYGTEKPGHYMYIESTSRSENDTARLISPVYDASLSNNGCFSFFYHMFGRTTGGLKVYQKPEKFNIHAMLLFSELTNGSKKFLLFEKWGNQGDFWYNDVLTLNPTHDHFQIVIEGIRGPSFTSDIAIDDVAILQGENCTIAKHSASTPPDVSSDTCAGRCFSNLTKGCGCTPKCFIESNCCPDFVDVCVMSYGDDSSSPAVDYEDTEAVTIASSNVINTTSPKTTTSSTTPKTIVTTTTTKPTIKVSSSTNPTRVTTKKVISTTKAKQTTKVMPTTKPVQTTKVVPTTKVKETTKVAPTSKFTTTKVKASTVVPATTIRRDVGKAQKEETEVRKLTGEDKESKSSVKPLLLSFTGILFIICIVSAIVFLRRPSGRFFMDKLRGRTMKDPEVRYLPSDVDDE